MNRFLIRLPLIYGLVGLFMLAFSSLIMDLTYSIGFNERVMSQLEVIIRLFSWVIIFTSLAMLINRYLKTGFSSAKVSLGSASVSFGNNYVDNNETYSSLEARLSVLENSQEKFDVLNDEDKRVLLNSLKERLSSSMEKEVENDIKENIKKRIVDERIHYLRKNLDSSMIRLSKEVLDLSRRGNLNLIIGALATLAGFLIFGMMVLDDNFKPAPENFITNFVPRLSLVILIEVFAYFFLGLYKSSLSEIKYFQNEITNIESKYSAMEYAVQYGDKDSINLILSQLSNTERNFLLKKGESTVMLEQDRMNSNSHNSIIEKLTELLSATKSPNK